MTTAITGTASGMGAAIRARMEKAGEKVIGIDLRNAEIVADLSTSEGRAAAISGIKQRCGDRLDHLVTVAGLAPDAHNASLITAVNYFGMVDLLDGLFQCLQQGNNPSAVVISSNSAQMSPMEDDPYVKALLAHNEAEAMRLIKDTNDFAYVYRASKNAVARAVRHRAVAWGKAGVRLNAVCPGTTNTPMHHRALNDPIVGANVKAFTNPLGRDAEPEEIAAVVTFLLSKEASYVHGAVYYADGGRDAQMRPDRF